MPAGAGPDPACVKGKGCDILPGEQRSTNCSSPGAMRAYVGTAHALRLVLPARRHTHLDVLLGDAGPGHFLLPLPHKAGDGAVRALLPRVLPRDQGRLTSLALDSSLLTTTDTHRIKAQLHAGCGGHRTTETGCFWPNAALRVPGPGSGLPGLCSPPAGRWAGFNATQCCPRPHRLGLI